MSFGWAKLSLLARAWTVLVCVAFVARAAIPAGYMPEIDQRTGEITVGVCTGDGSHKTVTIDLGGQPSKKSPKNQTCPYAVGVASTLPASATIIEAAQVYVFKQALTTDVRWSASAPWSAHAPPTGPPRLI